MKPIEYKEKVRVLQHLTLDLHILKKVHSCYECMCVCTVLPVPGTTYHTFMGSCSCTTPCRYMCAHTYRIHIHDIHTPYIIDSYAKVVHDLIVLFPELVFQQFLRSLVLPKTMHKARVGAVLVFQSAKGSTMERVFFFLENFDGA